MIEQGKSLGHRMGQATVKLIGAVVLAARPISSGDRRHRIADAPLIEIAPADNGRLQCHLHRFG